MEKTTEYRCPVIILQKTDNAEANADSKAAEIKTIEYFPGNIGSLNVLNLNEKRDRLATPRIQKTPSSNLTKNESALLAQNRFRERMDSLKRMVDEISAELPQEFFNQLHGGIALTERAKKHPQSDPRKPLYILGEYHNSHSFGRHIILYGKSILRVHGKLSDEELKDELRRIVRHEFTHHLESLSGTRDLEIYDEIRLENYKAELENRK